MLRSCGAVVLCLLAAGCMGRSAGGLTPPAGAPEWEREHDAAFDDGLTQEPVPLEGRAPNDVLDQRLFAQRLGFSDVVALVEVRQIYAKRRSLGRAEQFVRIEIVEILMGRLLPGTQMEHELEVSVEDALPAALSGQRLLLFLRWAPGERPPYRHHLTVAQPPTLAFVRALIEHAKDAGVLTDRGFVKKG